MWQFIKKNLLALVVIVGVARGIILAPYIWAEKPALKMLVLGVGLMNLALLLLYSKYSKNVINNTKQQAVLCNFCGLFVPLDIINSGQLKPHCCYLQPK